MKVIFVSFLLFSAGQENFTGRFERVTLYDHTAGIRCQYGTPPNMFWETFRGYECPMKVPIP